MPTPHQEGKEKCKRCGLLKSTVDAANIVCFSEEFHGVDISVTHDFSPNPHQEGGGRNLRDNKDGSCNCKPLGSSCFFTNWWTGGPCDCPCHTTPPTTKQGEECCDRDYPHEHLADGGVDISESPLAKGLKKVLEAPTTQSWEIETIEKLAAIEHERWSDWQKYCHHVLRNNLEPNIFMESILQRWDKQIATPYTELSEKEKQSDRDQVKRYWPIIRQTLATALKEQEERLVKLIEKHKDLACSIADMQYDPANMVRYIENPLVRALVLQHMDVVRELSDILTLIKSTK